MLQAPNKLGYTFAGWYKDSEFTTKVTEITKGSTGDITLYAKWELVTYTITYMLTEGTNSSENPTDYNVETESIVLKEPTRGGYVFVGWYKDSGFTTKITEITKGSTGDITLYAKWLENYTITYELYGGTNVAENPSSYNVETETIVLQAPNKSGYAFAGWYKDSEFTTKVTEITKGSTGDVTLYAKWKLVTYSITYELDGGINKDNPTNYNEETETIILKDPEKSGVKFAGWYTADNSPVTKIKKGSTGNITLYAKWVTDIEGKVFVRGGDANLNGKDIILSSFWISPYEVTQAEFESVMTGNSNGIEPNPSNVSEESPAEGEVQERRPVGNLSWYDAIVYCNLLSIKEGLTPCYTIKGSTNPADWGASPSSNDADWNGVTCDFDANGYRLPTEAEWEYAARGGQAGIKDGSWNYNYSGSDNYDDVAWHRDNSYNKTHEVGKKQANVLGIYDMSGNVEEWCWDWFVGNIYPSGTENPTGLDTGSTRVIRGGNCANYLTDCKVSYRGETGGSPYGGTLNIGFRVVCSIDNL